MLAINDRLPEEVRDGLVAPFDFLAMASDPN